MISDCGCKQHREINFHHPILEENEYMDVKANVGIQFSFTRQPDYS